MMDLPRNGTGVPLTTLARSLALTAIFLLAGAGAASAKAEGPHPPRAVRGILDLRSYDFDRMEPVRLDGEWEFYWERLLEPSALREGHGRPAAEYFYVPGIWNGRQAPGGGRIVGDGYATFRLLVLAGGPAGIRTLKIPVMATSYSLYVDGRLVASNGTVSSSARTTRPRYNPTTVSFESSGATIELVLHIANYSSDKGGPWNSILLGSEQQVMKKRDLRLLYEYVLLGGLLVMGLYHLGLFLLRRNDRSALYFGAFCLLIALRLTLTGEFILVRYFPGINWELEMKLEFLTIYAGLPLFALFIRSLFPEETPTYARTVYCAIGAVFCIPVLVLPLRVYSHFLTPFHAVSIAAFAHLIITVWRAMLRKRNDAVLLLIGLFILMASAVNDILDTNFLVRTGYLLPTGLFIFVLLQSFILSRRSSGAFADAMKLAYLRRELEIARRIQKSILPASPPVLEGMRMHVFTLPPEGISGDYYDWHIIDRRRIAILSADIVGHGVPAAMIASTLKVVFSLVRDRADAPASLLQAMNDILVGRHISQFVTASCGYIDLEARKIVYANAGHPPLILMSRESNEPIMADAQGRAMGWTDDIRCEDRTLPLHEGDRLVIYTDGIIECRNVRGEMFGETMFALCLKEWRDLPGDELSRRLGERLAAWRKPVEDFEDDITLIVIDLE